MTYTSKAIGVAGFASILLAGTAFADVCDYYKNRKVTSIEPWKDDAKDGKDGNLTKRGL